ncbi:hypothetical protein J4221_02250 [Candidatus Pacearchaeota archaeon]|nr:hypothetical protein [Candidatus Pacearchaeota archaeon]
MKFNVKLVIGIFLLVFSLHFVYAQYDNYYNSGSNYNPNYNQFNTNPNYYKGSNVYGNSYNPQFYPPGSGFNYVSPGNYFSGYGSYECVASQDLILQILPGSCSPSVVRSDLLEEQNVPVFCQVMALQANPLIDITRIRGIRIKGQYPPGVSGISYYPARAAVGGKRVFENSIFDDNLGYVVIVLSRQPNEDKMPEHVEGNITAIVDYITEASFGIGEPNFYLSEISDEEWLNNYKDYGFWNGRGYLRVESIENDVVQVGVYRDVDTRQTSVSLRKGQTSGDIFLSGFYCGAGLRVKVEDITTPRDSALIQINDVQSWVAKGDRIIENRCRVIDLESYTGGGKLKIQCPGEKLLELSLTPGGSTFSSLNREFFQVGIGSLIDNSFYLAHVGQSEDNKRYVVLINDNSGSEREFKEKGALELITKNINEKMTLDEIKSSIIKKLETHYKAQGINVSVGVMAENEVFSGITLNEVNIARDKNFEYEKLTAQQKLAHDYYDLSVNEYDNLINLYPGEKMEHIEEDPYAAKALLESAQLSRTLGYDGKAYEYYSQLIKEHSNSASARTAEFENRNLLQYDTTKSQGSVSVMNNNHFISLLDFKKPGLSELSAVLFIDGAEKNIGLRDSVTINKNNAAHTFRVVAIDDEYVDIEYERRINDNYRVQKKRLRIDQGESFNGINVRLIRTSLNKQVKLKVLSRGYGPQVESQFKFRVGIEKRAIPLTPDRAKEMIKNLQESIIMWDNINRKLGNFIRGLKGACFATAGVLTAKNIINGGSGAALSRGLIMTNPGGWNEKCEELVNKGQYKSVHECLLAHSNETEQDVKIYSEQIQGTNTIIKDIKNKLGVEQGIFGDEKIDYKKVEKEFKTFFDQWCKEKSDSITLPDKDKTKIILGDDKKSICNWETLTHEQRRDIITLYNARKSGGSEVLQDVTNRELGRILLDAKKYNEEYQDILSSERDASKYGLGLKTTEPSGDSINQGFIKTITLQDSDHSIYKNFKEGDKVVRVFIPREKTIGGTAVFTLDKNLAEEIGGKQVIVEMVYSENDNYYYPKENGKVYLVDGTLVSEAAAKEVRRYMSFAGLSKIKQSDKKAYENRMLNPEKLRIKYFERAPYKGLPAEIPFDVENGWYVEMTYVIAGFGRPYDESGRVVNFYICNVGYNGLIEFKKSSDDICRYYNENNPTVEFPGLSESESRLLIEKARRAIVDASRQYGNSKININGRSFESGISFDGSEGRCTDFMSAKDCTLLFNVCDPVICPASRCDFGGRYRVDNVIQSGVAGSLLLCLPNYKEGVAVPICLSGVHAGIQGYTSILNSTVDCLNESITTGRNVGICDEIRSVYICDFFWREAAPLAKIAVPRLFEGISGQSRGGGEYLNIQESWNNAQNAMSYFTQTYALNSIRAFSYRNINYAGGEFGADICKSFVSANFGGVKGFFRALIEPDSPVQYHAWFSENPLTTATIPPTSHYKVYYHIFAGQDFGAYYTIYLKDLPQLQGINTLGYYVVDRGYINRGQSIDRARDFIATSGFKQLCVNVNGQDECGFGKVSSSYALNVLSERYVAEQLNTNIKTEEECIAGTPSAGSLLNPNLQAGISDVINPQLYNQGIIRICSTENPGKRVLPTGDYDRTNSSYNRYQVVGYCDDPNIKCWLDTQTVKQVIVDKQLEKQILDQVNINSINQSNIWTYEQSTSVADRAELFREGFKIRKDDTRETIDNRINAVVVDLRKLSESGTTNVHRARAHYLLGKLYKKIAEDLWKGDFSDNVDTLIIDNEVVESSSQPAIEDSQLSESVDEEEYKLVNNKILDKNNNYNGYYIGIVESEEGLESFFIYQEKGFFQTLFPKRVGELINNKITFNIPREEWTSEMEKLNGATYDPKTGAITKGSLEIIENTQNVNSIENDNQNVDKIQENDLKINNGKAIVYNFKLNRNEILDVQEFDFDNQEIILNNGNRLRIFKRDGKIGF